MTAIKKKTGLVLTGGGARSAYQAGVLKAISEIAKSQNIDNPFQIITGTSAGSINAIHLAANSHRFHSAVDEMVDMWGKLHISDIYTAPLLSLSSVDKHIFPIS